MVWEWGERRSVKSKRLTDGQPLVLSCRAQESCSATPNYGTSGQKALPRLLYPASVSLSVRICAPLPDARAVFTCEMMSVSYTHLTLPTILRV